MKKYLLFVALLSTIFLVFGVIAPALISSASTELVILGVVIVMAAFPTIVFIAKRIFAKE